MPRFPRRSALLLAGLMALTVAAPLLAIVKPPLVSRIEVNGETPGGLLARAVTVVPAGGKVVQAQIRLKLVATGVASVPGRREWIVQSVEPGKEYGFPIEIRIGGLGEGSIRLQAESFDAKGEMLWGRTDELFVLETPGDRLRGHNSFFELKREKLSRDLARGKLSRPEHEEEFQNLLEGKELRFERQMRGLPEKKRTAAPTPNARRGGHLARFGPDDLHAAYRPGRRR
jgi:hypothetical protein